MNNEKNIKNILYQAALWGCAAFFGLIVVALTKEKSIDWKSAGIDAAVVFFVVFVWEILKAYVFHRSSKK